MFDNNISFFEHAFQLWYTTRNKESLFPCFVARLEVM